MNMLNSITFLMTYLKQSKAICVTTVRLFQINLLTSSHIDIQMVDTTDINEFIGYDNIGKASCTKFLYIVWAKI